MAELFNFSKHVSEIVKPLMKLLGYKKKGLHFMRENGIYIEEIWIQKSQWNMADGENQFYVNLYIYDTEKSDRRIYEHRIPRIPKVKFPPRYDEYYRDFSHDSRSTFSKEEEEAIHEYMQSMWWTYKDEDELRVLLDELADVFREHSNALFASLETEWEQYSSGGLGENPGCVRNAMNEVFQKTLGDIRLY